MALGSQKSYEDALGDGVEAVLAKGGVGAYELFRQAMDCFATAETMRPPGHDDAILRWNGCARVITRNNLEPREMGHDFLE